jgi:ribonuclease Y
MSTKIILLLAGAAGLIGIAIGYFLRLIISLGQRGSMELEIKGMMIQAKEEAKKIILDAENKAVETLKDIKAEAKSKEDAAKVTEARLIKKEDLLDKRQTDLDAEAENIKKKVIEIKEIKERVDKMEQDKLTELQKISGLTEEEAKNRVLQSVEKKYEDDILARIKKLELFGAENMKKKPRKFFQLRFNVWEILSLPMPYQQSSTFLQMK